LSSLKNAPFKLLHSFHSILYLSVGFKMAVLPIIQEDIIYDDESVFEEEAKIKKWHNLNLLVTVTIYCEELNRSMHHHKRMKKECWGGGGDWGTAPQFSSQPPWLELIQALSMSS
jgi:hypothetical protein